jgi:hypothetical protein
VLQKSEMLVAVDRWRGYPRPAVNRQSTHSSIPAISFVFRGHLIQQAGPINRLPGDSETGHQRPLPRRPAHCAESTGKHSDPIERAVTFGKRDPVFAPRCSG